MKGGRKFSADSVRPGPTYEFQKDITSILKKELSH